MIYNKMKKELEIDESEIDESTEAESEAESSEDDEIASAFKYFENLEREKKTTAPADEEERGREGQHEQQMNSFHGSFLFLPRATTA